MDLSTKRFYIFPDGPVFKVGLRPALVAHSVDYKVKVICSNLYREKRVEVIVNGTDENIRAFWTSVKQGELELPSEVKGYKTSELEPYEEGDIDWTYHTGALTMEQISTGTKYLKTKASFSLPVGTGHIFGFAKP